MIVRLILLIAFLIAAVTIIQLFRNTPKSQQKSMVWKIGLGTAAIVLVLLAATGRIHWVGAMIGALLPFIRQAIPLLMRFFPLIQLYQKNRPQPQPSSGNCSNVQTQILNMTLDHDTDRLYGDVISGPFAGLALDKLELDQLQTLLDYCHQQEQESAKLLISYLNHRFGNSWQSTPPPHTTGSIDEDAAYAILGLRKGATKEEVIQAHRKMMQKVHPDRGGSDFLAAQINEAKDLLMSKLT
ncbi:MAG: DnaJ domain-containing protein [Pseudomonadales bacterium]